jgi:NMD protein affecting ribosome stability and mRNA decay
MMMQKTQKVEGILQVRGKDIEDEVFSIIESFLKGDKAGTQINYKAKKKIFEFSSLSSTKKVAKKIMDRFSGEMKVTRTLKTWNRERSKPVYRTTILLEIPRYEVGSVILKDGKPYCVTRFGKQVACRDKDNKMRRFSHKNLKGVKIHGKIFDGIVLSKNPQTILLSDNRTIELGFDVFNEGETVKIVEYEDIFFPIT